MSDVPEWAMWFLTGISSLIGMLIGLVWRQREKSDDEFRGTIKVTNNDLRNDVHRVKNELSDDIKTLKHDTATQFTRVDGQLTQLNTRVDGILKYGRISVIERSLENAKGKADEP